MLGLTKTKQAALLLVVQVVVCGCVRPPKRQDTLDTRSLEEKLFYDVPRDYYTQEYTEAGLLFRQPDDCHD